MKTLKIIVLFVLCSTNILEAQNTAIDPITYKTWVSVQNYPFKTTGILYQVNDSSILVSNSYVLKNYSFEKFKTEQINICNIESIFVRNSNREILAPIIGFGIGFGVGAMLGYSSGDTQCTSSICFALLTAEEKAIISGAFLGTVGCLIGLSVGLVKIKIPINGKMDNYNKYKNTLRVYSIKK